MCGWVDTLELESYCWSSFTQIVYGVLAHPKGTVLSNKDNHHSAAMKEGLLLNVYGHEDDGQSRIRLRANEAKYKGKTTAACATQTINHTTEHT